MPQTPKTQVKNKSATNSSSNHEQFLNDFNNKKKIFDSTIANMKEFTPSTGENNKTKRSTRVSNDEKSTKAHLSDTHDSATSFLIEQVKYMFNLNAALIESVKILNSRCQALEDTVSVLDIENKEIKTACESLTKKSNDMQISNSNVCISDSSLTPHHEGQDFVRSIEQKIDDLQQLNLNSTMLLRGELVNELITKKESDPSNTLKILVQEKLNELLPDSNEIIRNKITSARTIGKDKKAIRVDLVSNQVRNNTVNSIRRIRHDGLYAYDFLTLNRYKLFLSARNKANGNENIEWVRTKSGFVIYRSKSHNKVFTINSANDIEKMT